jgi:outer membrane protein OmpA-like peptidoglycan-associated protein
VRARRKARAKKGHGALWSIIYIDLMTQIMAFFVIVWTLEHGARATQTADVGSGFGMGMGDQTVRMVDLPGDVLFGSGKTDLGADGKDIITRLFGDPSGGVLDFDRGGLAERKLVIHGHTDDVGPKDDNFALGFQRAWSVYLEIRKHSKELPEHVVLCTHANNTPTRPLPTFESTLTDEEKAVIREARAKNRRITIEDLVVASPGLKQSAAVP